MYNIICLISFSIMKFGRRKNLIIKNIIIDFTIFMRGKKILLFLLSIIIIFILCIVFFIIWYNSSLKSISKVKNEDAIRIEIPEGSHAKNIAKILENKKVIKSAKAMELYIKFNNITSLKAGKYDLYNSDDVKTITAHIVNGDVADDSVKLTLIEGKNMRWIAKKISEKTNCTEDDVFNLLEDEDYINSLIDKYWFITDDIKNEDIYYPLEGYLLPDTYIFENEDITVKEIFNVILNFTDKYLSNYKEEIENSDFSIHEILTMASMAELEGNTLEDRKEIVGVFINRLNEEMSLGSDVTTYYAFKVDMGERDLKAKELNTENPYNTRGPNMAGKLPVGPICNPSKEAIEATLDYSETDALYFVADKNGKVYFTKSNDEHNKIIKELKDKGLWFTY